MRAPAVHNRQHTTSGTPGSSSDFNCDNLPFGGHQVQKIRKGSHGTLVVEVSGNSVFIDRPCELKRASREQNLLIGNSTGIEATSELLATLLC